MSKQEDDFLYDEDDAVKYIRNYLPQELKSKFKNCLLYTSPSPRD